MELHSSTKGMTLSLKAIIFAACCCLSAFTAAAYKFYAGGRDGWVVHPSEDYNHWAGRNRFLINDIIYFKYKKGEDSVLLVNKDDYDNCNTKSPIKRWDDGDTTFTFDRSGPFYFISGQDGHCKDGQKLTVVVLHLRRPPPLSTSPPPSQAPAANPPAPVVGPTPPSQAPGAQAPAPVVGPTPPSQAPGAQAPAPVVGPTPPSPPSQAPGAAVPAGAPGATVPATSPPAPAGPALSPGVGPGPAAALPPGASSPPGPPGSTSPSGSVAPGLPSPGLPANGSATPTPPNSSAWAARSSGTASVVGLMLAMVFCVTSY